jgi:hypothetical protein
MLQTLSMSNRRCTMYSQRLYCGVKSTQSVNKSQKLNYLPYKSFKLFKAVVHWCSLALYHETSKKKCLDVHVWIAIATVPAPTIKCYMNSRFLGPIIYVR